MPELKISKILTNFTFLVGSTAILVLQFLVLLIIFAFSLSICICVIMYIHWKMHKCMNIHAFDYIWLCRYDISVQTITAEIGLNSILSYQLCLSSASPVISLKNDFKKCHPASHASCTRTVKSWDFTKYYKIRIFSSSFVYFSIRYLFYVLSNVDNFCINAPRLSAILVLERCSQETTSPTPKGLITLVSRKRLKRVMVVSLGKVRTYAWNRYQCWFCV